MKKKEPELKLISQKKNFLLLNDRPTTSHREDNLALLAGPRSQTLPSRPNVAEESRTTGHPEPAGLVKSKRKQKHSERNRLRGKKERERERERKSEFRQKKTDKRKH